MHQQVNKSEDAINEDVQTIKKWLQSQPHLPEIMDDAKIRNFFIRNKYSIERTKGKIDMYYTMRSLIPEIYEYTNPKLPNNRSFMENAYCFIYPTKDVDVGFLKMKEPNKLAPREIVIVIMNVGELKMEADGISSELYVVDMKNMTLNDIMKVTPSLAMKGFAIYEKVWSFRMKGIYLMNAPPYVSILMGIMKNVLKTKIFNRIRICQDEEILKEIFTQDTLPKDYGGNGPTLQELTDMTKARLDRCQDRFDALDKMKVDETLRPQKLNNDELLGFHGNFKKLSVD